MYNITEKYFTCQFSCMCISNNDSMCGCHSLITWITNEQLNEGLPKERRKGKKGFKSAFILSSGSISRNKMGKGEHFKKKKSKDYFFFK